MLIRQRPISTDPSGVSVGPICNGAAASVSICGHSFTDGGAITRIALVSLENGGSVPYVDNVTLQFNKANSVFRGTRVRPLSTSTKLYIKYA